LCHFRGGHREDRLQTIAGRDQGSDTDYSHRGFLFTPKCDDLYYGASSKSLPYRFGHPELDIRRGDHQLAANSDFPDDSHLDDRFAGHRKVHKDGESHAGSQYRS
jgi:hypothetical protein